MKNFLFQVIFIFFNTFVLDGQSILDTTVQKKVNIHAPRQLDTIANLTSDTFYFATHTYKIVIGKNYKSPYFPRVAHNQLVLTDKNGKVQNLSVVYYEFDVAVRNNAIIESNYNYYLPYNLKHLNVNQSIEITKVRVIDINGAIKNYLVQPFIIRRIK